VDADAGLGRRIAAYAVPVMATNTSLVLDKRVDTLLVGFFLSPVAVSFYVIGDKVVSLVLAPISALSFTVAPTFGAQKAAGNVDRVARIYEESLVKALLVYVPAGAGLVLVADPLIRLAFGPDYGGAVAVLRVLGLYVVLSAVVQISDNGLDYLGRARERAIARLITAGLNVSLNVVLIPAIGVVGAAIATVGTRALYTAANVTIIASELDLRVAFVLRKVVLIVLSTAAMSAVVYALVDRVSGWLTLALVVLAGVAVWAVLTFATGLLDVDEVASVVS
jgi:O-antigen/teichoic acid export membrane protein